jgi:hypothetical protein
MAAALNADDASRGRVTALKRHRRPSEKRKPGSQCNKKDRGLDDIRDSLSRRRRLLLLAASKARICGSDLPHWLYKIGFIKISLGVE